MSSATSIEKPYRLKPDAAKKGERRRKTEAPAPSHDAAPEVDNGFKPWHFFVMASLLLATVAVVMSRQGTPEHLILISFTIGAAGAAAAGFYRMLAPLATEDASLFSAPLTDRSRAVLEREKALVMRSIKELEFDRAMGKVSPRDFDEMAGRLRARALMLMKQLDEGDSVYRELIEKELAARVGKRVETPAPVPAATPGTCSSCATVNDLDAAFCKKCGSRIAEASFDVARGGRS